MVGCGDSSTETSTDTETPAVSTTTATQPSAAQPATPPTPEPAQNAEGVWHFTCAKGCEGGGASASETCKKCGGPLAHNQGYHGSQPTPSATTTIDPSNPNPTVLPPTTKAPEPAQNASGVWHFTCAKGCEGGGAAASETCKKCGGPLAHNQGYHQ